MLGRRILCAALIAAIALTGGCGGADRGPIRISAIGSPPHLLNPNLRPLDPPAAMLAEASAQGLVRFDAAGEIEPALAQSWIVSDDGLRYTFRLRRATWVDGGARVTAAQVVARLKASLSRASRNPLKPVLGAIDDIVAMTDEVLEISLKGPRPNFLQLLAQPEMSVALGDRGTGPYRVVGDDAAGVRLAIPADDDRDDEDGPEAGPRRAPVQLRGESAAQAIARFRAGRADLVTGGTIGDLPFARTADLPSNRLVLDPAQGLLALAFLKAEGPLGDPAIRRALAMAVDRDSIAAEALLAGFAGRAALIGPGIDEVPTPAQPDWASQPIGQRRQAARTAIAALPAPMRLRVAMPGGPGYRLIFAHLRRDWAAIGVEATAVAPGTDADLALIDAVAPSIAAPWYLRRFSCDASAVCEATADAALADARTAPDAAARQIALAKADQILSAITAYIVIGAPLRWSLVAPRLNGFRPNPFARHPIDTLIAAEGP